MPTFQRTPRFDRDWKTLTTAEQRRFRRVISSEFVPGLARGAFRPGLRVKPVQSARGAWEMTWAPDGRATFEYGSAEYGSAEYGSAQRTGEPHIIWRRIGGHAVFRNP